MVLPREERCRCVRASSGSESWARAPGPPGHTFPAGCAIRAARSWRLPTSTRPGARRWREDLGVGEATADWQALVARANVDVIDIATPSRDPPGARDGRHRVRQARALREAGRLRLPPDPWAGEVARQKGLKTKLGFTFRYSPGVRYARELLDQGFVGRPFIFNGYEQNSQWINPQTPLRQVDHTRDQSTLPSPRWRGTARRSSTSAAGGWAPTTAASSARCATSCRSGSSARPAR